MSDDPVLSGCLVYFLPKAQVTTLGGHYENQIVIKGPGISDFLVISLPPEEERSRVLVNGQLLKVGECRSLRSLRSLKHFDRFGRAWSELSLGDLWERLGEERGNEFFCLSKAAYLVDEVWELHQHVSRAAVSDIVIRIIQSSEGNSSLLSYWTVDSFKQLLETMRDCYGTFCSKGQWNGKGDPLEELWQSLLMSQLQNVGPSAPTAAPSRQSSSSCKRLQGTAGSVASSRLSSGRIDGLQSPGVESPSRSRASSKRLKQSTGGAPRLESPSEISALKQQLKDKEDVEAAYWDRIWAHERSLLGIVLVGTHDLAVPPDTPLVSFTHLTVFARSSLVESATPMRLAIVDSVASVSQVNFTDLEDMVKVLCHPHFRPQESSIELCAICDIVAAQQLPKLRGLIHLAAVLADATMPKLTRHLERSYDGHARYWKQVQKESVISVQWGPWKEGTVERRQSGVGALSNALGMAALAGCEKAAPPLSTTLVAQPMRWAVYLKYPKILAFALAGFGAVAVPQVDKASLKQMLQQISAEVSGGSVDSETPLMDSGMASLFVVEFRNSFTGPGVNLPNTLIFDYPTISSIADFTASHMGPAPAAAAPMGQMMASGRSAAEVSVHVDVLSMQSWDFRKISHTATGMSFSVLESFISHFIYMGTLCGTLLALLVLLSALVALDCLATALRKGRCFSALNTAANVMAHPSCGG